MILVHGFVPYRRAQRDRALVLFEEMAQAARAEPGCRRYDVFLATSGEATLFLLQEWDSLDELSAHFHAPALERLRDSLADVLDGEIDTRRFEIPELEMRPREAARPVVH